MYATRQNSTNVLFPPDKVAQIPLTSLDWVWFYPAGTICNLECTHCLVDAGPKSQVLLPLETEELEIALQEVYWHKNEQTFQIGLTGGEVFLLKAQKYGRRLFPMIESCLKYGNLLILTNGILADDETLKTLKEIEERAVHSIGFRISLDGPSAAENDEIRRYRDGRPSFFLIMKSLQRFLQHGFQPAIAYTYEGSGKAVEVLQRYEKLHQQYKTVLSEHGVGSLELVGIPFFDQGAETQRRKNNNIPHIQSPGITNNCITQYTDRAYHLFQCSYGRSFAKEANGETGWYKCPILPTRQIAKTAFVGLSIEEAACEITIEHPQCITCFNAATQGSGMSCSGT